MPPRVRSATAEVCAYGHPGLRDTVKVPLGACRATAGPGAEEMAVPFGPWTRMR